MKFGNPLDIRRRFIFESFVETPLNLIDMKIFPSGKVSSVIQTIPFLSESLMKWI